jgi:multiple antibiotic resistance protein
MIWPELAGVTGVVLLTFGALFPVVNPLGDGPLFLAMTARCDDPLRIELAKRIGLYSFALLLGSMLLGGFVLRIFGLSIPVVQVAGGALVCAFGWNLLGDSPRPPAAAIDPDHERQATLGRAFYPLTMPLSVDAGAISVAITVGAHHGQTIGNAITHFVGAVVGGGLIAASIFLTYRYAEWISRRVGPTGMTVLLKLSAFIMLCIGVAISWNGVQALVAQLGLRG